MNELYLLRHGETEWNVARRVQGAGDSPLTVRGIAQAQAMGALLARHIAAPAGFDLVSSPQGRARHTAELVGAALGLTVRTDARLVEVSLGAWDGMTRFEIDAEHPGALAGATAYDWYFRAPDGEAYETVSARVASWLGEVRRPTIAVSHGLTGQVLRAAYAGLGREEALKLAKPQHGLYRLSGGRIEFLAAAGEPTRR